MSKSKIGSFLFENPIDMSILKKEDCYYLGRITKPFGYKGELSIYLDVDTPEEYAELDGVYVEINKRLVLYEIENIRVQGNKAVVKFADVNGEDTDRLTGRDLYLPLTMLPPLKGNNFYFHEVIGFAVYDQEKGCIGTIAGVYENTTQPLLSVEFENKEILIPIIDQVIKQVDRENKQMHIQAPAGLIDLYLN